MILHCVFCQFDEAASRAEREDVLKALAEFSRGLDGVLAFDWGPNRDFERKSQAYSDGFVIRFSDRAALERYAEHPTHQQLGAQLCALCVGGGDGIAVFDLEIP
ncbi:Dabb family protein [Phaeobacter inhibens]|uniref:Dabb family protein n=1 Tax=Phaeobacter inhibens TaxID=221822 RepID=UPI0021A43F47|nr:Dabb family protein [Phaeobacter inhibens]UWR91217.1 Dabb family protein [Phaeobacter inhibens]